MTDLVAKPVSIFIEPRSDYQLTLDEIKYTFETILISAGIPWRFLSPDEREKCDIYFGDRSVKGVKARMLIRMSVHGRDRVRRPSDVRKSDSLSFLLFNEAAQGCFVESDDRNKSVIINNDIIFSSFFLLSGWEESFVERDGKDRHRVEALSLYRFGLMHTPIVNQYAQFIRRYFEATHYPLPPWPDGKKYALALSHDVDYPEIIPGVEILRYIVQNRRRMRWPKIADIWKGREHFFKFADWVDLERGHGLKSAFYFCGLKGSLPGYFLRAPDPFYDIRKKIYSDVMHMLDENGWEVGVHSSYLAYRSGEQYGGEKANVETCLGKPVFGVRHHYWHMNPDNPSDTADLQESLGFLYDSSISFEKHSGFRRGICSPFHLYNKERKRRTRILQLPTALMDDHLFGYAKLAGFDNYREHIDSLLRMVKENGGVFVADYHDRVLNDTFFPGWGASYEYLLNRMNAEEDCYCDTPLNVAKCWIDREQALLEASV